MTPWTRSYPPPGRNACHACITNSEKMRATGLFWKRLKPYRTRLAILMAVIGPGIITANVDNDAGGITTYSVSGAHYGYGLLWIMPLVAIALVIVQEMSARLGIIIGIILIANLANTVSEFAGVAASMEIFGVSKYVSVPIAALAVWLLIVK